MITLEGFYNDSPSEWDETTVNDAAEALNALGLVWASDSLLLVYSAAQYGLEPEEYDGYETLTDLLAALDVLMAGESKALRWYGEEMVVKDLGLTLTDELEYYRAA